MHKQRWVNSSGRQYEKTILYGCACNCLICSHGGTTARAERHSVCSHGSGPEDSAGGGAAEHGVSPTARFFMLQWFPLIHCRCFFIFLQLHCRNVWRWCQRLWSKWVHYCWQGSGWLRLCSSVLYDLHWAMGRKKCQRTPPLKLLTERF